MMVTLSRLNSLYTRTGSLLALISLLCWNTLANPLPMRLVPFQRLVSKQHATSSPPAAWTSGLIK